MEIAQGIHRIQAPLGNRIVCTYLLVGSQRSMLIDTGIASVPEGYIIPYMEQIGFDPANLTYVLISHADFDHTGGSGAMRRHAPDAIFMCHEFDRHMIEDVETIIAQRYSVYAPDHGFDESPDSKAFIRAESEHIPMDMTVRGGEVIHLGSGWRVEILHAPGHSRGHLSVYDPRSSVMIVLDAVLYNAVLTAEGEPAFPPTYRYVDTYLATTHRLQSYDLDIMATSHYPLTSGQGAINEFLGETATYVDRVKTELRAFLKAANTPPTMPEVIQNISPKVGRWPEEAAPFLTWSLTGHFERLASAKLIELGRRDRLVTAKWVG